MITSLMARRGRDFVKKGDDRKTVESKCALHTENKTRYYVNFPQKNPGNADDFPGNIANVALQLSILLSLKQSSDKEWFHMGIYFVKLCNRKRILTNA